MYFQLIAEHKNFALKYVRFLWKAIIKQLIWDKIFIIAQRTT